jgi:AraC-like DNA-binding protein
MGDVPMKSNSVEKHIAEAIEKFFYCTHIPIKAFNFMGPLIHSVGYNRDSEEVFDNNEIYEKIKKILLSAESASSIVTVSCHKDIYFTACNICPINFNRGIIIIGPYACHKATNIGIVYKPSSCIPHLIALLRNIAKDSPYIKQKQFMHNTLPYSLHVKTALDYIDARYNEPITLTQISKYLKLTKCYFCTLLKKDTGKTFSQILNEIRIAKSKLLLVEGNLSILDIAYLVGFNNQSYYNKTFKYLTNMTPLEFRNNSDHVLRRNG